MCTYYCTHKRTHINIYTGLHLLFLICYAQWEEEDGKKHSQVAKRSKSPAKEATLKRAQHEDEYDVETAARNGGGGGNSCSGL